jgi:hypothetical protein
VNLRRRAAVAVGVLIAAATWLLALPALAQETTLSPSEFVACLTRSGGLAPVYPPEALDRRDGGTVRVELEFSAPDTAPTVRFLGKDAFESLRDAVRLHVKPFRLPCLPVGHAPVTIRQDYVFTPNDGRKVIATAPREPRPSGQRQLDCLKLTGDQGRPEYPKAALQAEQQGVVLLALTFEAPDRSPQIDVVARPSSTHLVNSARNFASRLRMPCLKDSPLTVDFSYAFVIDGGDRVRLNDMGLASLVRLAKSYPKGVYFDTRTMSCPFDLRISYWQPHRRNSVAQLDKDDESRHALMDWIAQIELKLPPDAENPVLGGEFLVQVPCIVVDL